ncbi:hypothetical protein [Salinispora mooreana]|uniref:hypothetical protein n=1 Tax=Salinispora mooreana TaxID=999545 RepID=UPI0003A412CC|nr:hypothetical protein [Salinispora mooreana]
MRIRLAFGATIADGADAWTWTDVTEYWHAPDPIEIEWGRQPGAEQAETSTLQITLNNTDGRFTAGNLDSPHWPHIDTWVPISVDIDLGDGGGWRNRFSGYVRRWPVTWPGRSGKLAVARVEAVGLLGRLSRGTPASASPWRRMITSRSLSGLLAYWPCEDRVNATQAASGLPDGRPMAVTGDVRFADLASDIVANSSGLSLGFGSRLLPATAGGNRAASMSGGTLTGLVPAGTSDPLEWSVCWVARPVTSVSTYAMLRWETPGGSFTQWEYRHATPMNESGLWGRAADGTWVQFVSLYDDSPTLREYRVEAWQDSPIWLGLRLWVDGIKVEDDRWVVTLGRVTRVTVNPRATDVTALAVTQVQVWDTATPPHLGVHGMTATVQPIDGYGETVYPHQRWVNETAHDRLARLCAEDGVPLDMPAVDRSMVMRMGPQPDGAPLALYQQCETTDLGLIYESGFGLGYVPRASRYNQEPALTIDSAARRLGGDLEPVADDQRLRNVITVERIGGSSATAIDRESVAVRGEIAGSVPGGISLATDDRLQDHAAWRLHIASGLSVRYPKISMRLHNHASRALAADWVACRPGSRVRVVNAPTAAPASTIDQVIVGARETITGRRDWVAELATEPAARWDVAAADGAQRVAADGSTIAAVSESGLTLTMTSTIANGPWTTDPSDFPLDLRIGGHQGTGGERATVAAISGNGLTQTVTLYVRAVNGISRAWSDGTQVDVWAPAVAAL